jgi:cell division protein FtsB
MPPAAVTTLVLTALLVVVLAIVLVWVVLLLRRIDGILGDVHQGVRRVAEQTAPLDESVTAINGDLQAVADALTELARRAEGRSPVR